MNEHHIMMVYVPVSCGRGCEKKGVLVGWVDTDFVFSFLLLLRLRLSFCWVMVVMMMMTLTCRHVYVLFLRG